MYCTFERRSLLLAKHPRFALFLGLGVASISLHACARSVSSDPGVDSNGLFGPDAGDAGLLNKCVATECPPPFVTCPGAGLCTTNLTTDVSHCGSCANACAKRPPNAGSICSGGACKVFCDPLFADCNGQVADGCEVATDADPRNCGACGNVCKAGDICWRGACGCPKGFTVCGTECKKLDSDSDNCGACDNACKAPLELADPAWICGPGASPANTTWVCETSACALDCKPGYGNCNKNLCLDGCEIDLATDPGNCGSCGHTCDAGQTCAGGTCLCPPGQTNCGDICVDLTNDVTNCGRCGNYCPGPTGGSSSPFRAPTPKGGSPLCKEGSCSYVCFPGFADCDGALSNGCEININTDPHHCGGCDSKCNLPAGQPCVLGQCLTKECEAGTIF